MSKFMDAILQNGASSGAGSAPYRIGLVGSVASGKTCLLAALGMVRRPNPRGGAAHPLALKADAPSSVKAGHAWIDQAKANLEQGKWPPFNPVDNQQRSILYQFTDRQARVKLVEVSDYSGELLRPETSQTELATRIRALLRETDGLMVLAEHPVAGQDDIELERELNGLMRVVTLLDSEKPGSAKHSVPPVPVALVINKWDRSAYFVETDALDAQRGVLLAEFLHRERPPIHAAIMDTLQAVAQGRFEVFPVSACGAVASSVPKIDLHSVELPPKPGPLASFALEDPFLWLIEQSDDLRLEEIKDRLNTFSRHWWLPPWVSLCALRNLGEWSRERIGRETPEYPRVMAMRNRCRKLVLRQTAIYILLLLLVEGGYDFWAHRKAEERLQARGAGASWREGCSWLRDYGVSPLGRHLVYSGLVFHKQKALVQAQEFESAKDEEELGGIRTAFNNRDTEITTRLLKEHSGDFPNSPHAEECHQIDRDTNTLIRTRNLREQLADWLRNLDPLRKNEKDSSHDIESKLAKLVVVQREVARAQDLPAEGEMRDRWNSLLNDFDQVRKELATALSARDLNERFHQALASDDYQGALDLFSSPEFRQMHDQSVLDAFLQGLPAGLQRKCDTLARDGESWEQAAIYAGQLLVPQRVGILPDTVRAAVEQTVERAKQQGDTYIYKLALENHNNESMQRYLDTAPLKAMASEVQTYLTWLKEREVKRKLTFKLVEINWQEVQAGWRRQTIVKLFVNDGHDDRNDTHEADFPRSDPTTDAQGYRRVTVEAAQTAPASIDFQVWDIPAHFGGSDKLIEYHKEVTAEVLAERKWVADSSGKTTLKFEVDGVRPEPPLPAWHPAQ